MDPPSARTAATPGDDPAGDPVLVDRLRAEIEKAGPIPFARFMEVALYDPDRGYYTGPAARPTREGDFLTAPELHPLFGRTLARQVAECWDRLERPDAFRLREYGAGAGTLGLTILEGLATEAPELARSILCEPIERNPHRRAELVDRFRAAGLEGRVASPPPPGRPAGPWTGLVLANEFVDALPVHRIVWRDGRLQEIFVGVEADRFVDVPGPPSTSALAARLAADGVRLVEGQRGEVCLAIDAWVADAIGTLERGYLIIIDYGHPAAELYGPRRLAGTLLGYRGHRVVDDPYVFVGRQDLTAHVDLTALERAARAAGGTVLGTTTQAEFLTGLGIGDELVAAGRGSTSALGDYLAARAAVLRLLDPAAMGRFRVVVVGREVPATPVLRGLGFRLRERSVARGDGSGGPAS